MSDARCARAAAGWMRRIGVLTPFASDELPALYLDRAFVADGGLIAYGPDRVNQYRIADGYVDRILNGEKPEAFISSPV